MQAYSLKDIEGNHASLNITKNARLISIFTSWCSVCKVELKQLNKDYVRIQKENLPIDIGVVNAGESKKKVAKYKLRRKLNLSIYMDQKLDFVKDLQVLGTPAILIFDKDNTRVYQGSELPKDWIEQLSAL